MVRQNGTTPEQVMFKDLLLRLRNGETTEEDWRLPTVQILMMLSTCFNKDKVAHFNIEKLNSLSTPIARINAKHLLHLLKLMTLVASNLFYL